MKTISEKIDLYVPVTALFIFALLLGIEIGFIHDNLNTSRSIVIAESIFSIDNMFCVYVAAVFFILAFKAKEIPLKIAYFVGGMPLMLETPIFSSILGINNLYIIIIKIVLLFIACSICIRFITAKLGRTEGRSLLINLLQLIMR
jgi:hypothetical protein